MMTEEEITETTCTAIAEAVEKPQMHSPEEALAADLVQVVEETKPAKIEKTKIIKVKPLEAPEYVDPIEQDYFIQRNNCLDTPERRNSPEGIAMIHETIRFIGEQVYP